MTTLVVAAIVIAGALYLKRARPPSHIQPEAVAADRDYSNSKGLPPSLAPYTEAEISPQQYRTNIRDSQALKSYFARSQ